MEVRTIKFLKFLIIRFQYPTMVDKQKRKNYEVAIKWSGWGASICFSLFFLNIFVGKILHITKVSVNSPINGPAEFLLLGLVILQFTICVLLKESMRTSKEQ